MKLYHRIHHAKAILASGFWDGSGTYMRGNGGQAYGSPTAPSTERRRRGDILLAHAINDYDRPSESGRALWRRA